MSASDKKVFSVTQLTSSIKRNLEANNVALQNCWIEGEISGWNIYKSEHAYFVLKDAGAQISCFYSKWRYKYKVDSDARFRAKFEAGELDGTKILVKGQLSVNATRGNYSYIVEDVELFGVGDLMALYEELKRKLQLDGLFDAAKKRPLPFLPRRIGIVTSPAGAVIHDMCKVLLRRFPNLEITLYPVKVQGEGAAEEVVRGIEYFNEVTPDLIIVGRGGGSIEDLWTFNEEKVVRAVAQAKVPIISAVGHETDFTLCDFAADVRAGTPSIAAELAVPLKSEVLATINLFKQRLLQAPMGAFKLFEQRIVMARNRLAKAPEHACEMLAQRIDYASEAISKAPKRACEIVTMQLERLESRLDNTMVRAYSDICSRLERSTSKLTLLDPANPLKRGYSLTLDENGKTLRSVNNLEKGTKLTTRFADGEVESKVI